MNKGILAIGAILAGTFLLTSAPAEARPKKGETGYQRCMNGCDLAKTHLLKACEQADTAEAKQKCRTLGVKKLEEECVSRCKERKGK
jgi:hypothetical protein